jgi:uncharacterized small protein (DUF1192 family)
MARRFGRKQDKSPRDDGVEDVPPPLFTLERQDEKRIVSWSPDPFDEDGGQSGQSAAVELPEAGDRTGRPPAPQKPRPGPAPPPRPDPPAGPRAELPRRDVASAVGPRGRTNAVDQVEPKSPPPRAVVPPSSEGERQERQRGRPRGRAVRRQVHFHVDPAEEQLLVAAVAMLGSQQKGLIAALESLQEAELLRDEIERLQAECERQRELLAEAEALFNKS